MIFISAQPHNPYFVWQVEVQIVNFRKHGISDKMHVLIWYPDNKMRKEKGEQVENVNMNEWLKVAAKYPEVKFFFYKDRGIDYKLYIPQLRPHILARHFDKLPFLRNEVIFYHDSDIIFNYLPDFPKLSEGDVNWQSDTSSYLDYNYLRNKEIEGNIPENEAVQVLCDIGGVDIETFRSYNGKTGGAQYILKNIDGDFWRDVERMCLHIRGSFMHGSTRTDTGEPSINEKYFPSENKGFQSWCADMWAVNMALWSRGRKTDITKELDFSWATDDSETYLKKPIFHNAGATGQPGIFFKGKWVDKSPIGLNHAVKKGSASWFYAQAIMDVK